MQSMKGGAIVLGVVRVTSRSRTAQVGKFAQIFMNAEVEQLYWECRVKHKVAVEGSE